MATYYIPDSTGWKSTLAKGSGSGHLRIRIDQTYTASTNQSSLTASIEIKSDGTGSGTGYHMQDGGSFKFPASSSSASTVNHNYTLSSLSTSSFTALQTSGSTKYWSVTVTHNADGTATVYASVSGFRLQNSGRTRIWTWDKSGSITLSNTPSYTLSLSVGVHSGGTVKRDGTALSNGATINRGDTLVFDYAPDPGYSIGTHTVNGTARSSGYSWTVTGAATVITTATVISNTLTVSAGTGTTITVNRQSSPLGGASTGVITSGATVYYNDTLEVTFTANTGYILATHTIQGVTQDSGYVYTVLNSAVIIVATSIEVSHGGIYINDSQDFTDYKLIIYDGANWYYLIPKIHSGIQWEDY